MRTNLEFPVYASSEEWRTSQVWDRPSATVVRDHVAIRSAVLAYWESDTDKLEFRTRKSRRSLAVVVFEND